MKWWLIAWREIRWEVFLDRASLLRTGVFIVIPLFFVLSNRGIAPGPQGDATLIGLALQSVFFPALSGVALIAATFSAEKENGTLVPLLAAPICRAIVRRRRKSDEGGLHHFLQQARSGLPALNHNPNLNLPEHPAGQLLPLHRLGGKGTGVKGGKTRVARL